MNYDNWKLDNPYEEEDNTYECAMCDAPISEAGYCSTECRNADD
jgi:hypothetical protein